MSIPDTFHFDKDGEVVKYPKFRPYFLTVVIILVALLAFGIGRLTSQGREGVKINYNPEALTAQNKPQSPTGGDLTSVTASSQGSRYYFSHCGNNISEKNRVTFASVALAEKAGYTLAANCKAK